MRRKIEECARYLTKERRINSTFKKKWLYGLIWFKQKVLGRIELPYIEMFITTHCNLRCVNCSNLIPTMKNKKHLSKEIIYQTVYQLLNNVDCIYRLKIHGGEVFLHPDLADVITYLDNNKKIMTIRLATNGTIIPDEQVIIALKKSKVVVQISDYDVIQVKRNRLIQTLEEHDIKYVYLKDQIWRDMGNFEVREKSRYSSCGITSCNSLYNDNIYLCSRAAIAHELGYINENKQVKISYSRRTFKKQINAFYRNDDFVACKHCDGDTTYAKTIPIRIQEGTK